MNVQMILDEKQVQLVRNYDKLNDTGQNILLGFSGRLFESFPPGAGKVLIFKPQKRVKSA
jgi:hypothetical protein